MVNYHPCFFDLVHGRNLIILDFDGVICPDSQEFDLHRQRAGAEAALEMMKEAYPEKDISLEDVIEENRAANNGDEVDYSRYCSIHGLEHKRWHHAYNGRLDEKLAPPSHLSPAHLQACPHQVAILSHADNGWITRKLRQDGLHPFFPQDRIFALEDVNGHLKSNGGAAYRLVLGKLGVEPEQAIMVDNQPANLSSAHDMGIATVLIAQENGNGLLRHEHVDYVFSGVALFMASLARTKTFVCRQRRCDAGLRL